MVGAARERCEPPQHIVHASVLHVEGAPVVLQPVPVGGGLETLARMHHVRCILCGAHYSMFVVHVGTTYWHHSMLYCALL